MSIRKAGTDSASLQDMGKGRCPVVCGLKAKGGSKRAQHTGRCELQGAVVESSRRRIYI